MDFAWQYLEKGKALCGKTFPNFVETWRRVLDVLANLKGDADVDDTQGHIKIDRSDPAHPVIRYVTPETSSGGDGSGDDDDEDEDEETDAVVTSANGATGDVNVIGGKGIEVSTDGQTIKVTWNKDKEDEDEDPNEDKDDGEPSNPCDHDSEGGGEGGVEAGGGGGGGGAGSGVGGDAAGGGGVPAGGGESHTGDDNCNCG